jgi:hypothetical protein
MGGVESGPEGAMIVPGNKRKMQVRRKERRKLFGKERKESFLEQLAATCNVAASAEAAGVVTGTVYQHRMTDPEFREKWWLALEQGAAKLVALRLQREVERAERLEVKGDLPPDEASVMDLLKLMQQLREHVRGLSGEAKPGRAPQTASLDEACEALAKRLKAFGLREAAAEASKG